jgi:hypothetical protein
MRRTKLKSGGLILGEPPPMWTTENRARYDRNHLRYPSDLTDAEWALIEPCIPPAKRGGNKRSVNVREIVNGLMRGASCLSLQSINPVWGEPIFSDRRPFSPAKIRKRMQK